MTQVKDSTLGNNFLTHKHLVDLIYFDGPLLSLFENEHGHLYLYCWSDVDKLHNRWLVFRISKELLRNYWEGKVNLRELIQSPEHSIYYLVDIDDTLEVKHFIEVQPHNLPESYIAKEDSYYDDSLLDSESWESDKKLIHQIIYE